MNQTNPAPLLTDILVVVHGIGQQLRNDTVRSVASRLAHSPTLYAGGQASPVAPQPLGYFHSDLENLVATRLVDEASRLAGMQLATVGVAEVFWADIPEEVSAEGRTLEETKAWASTVVARARALWSDSQAAGGPTIVPPDFGLAAEVLDQVIETIYVLGNIFALTEKAGFFTFDLRKVLDDYLGDVQIVADFEYFRNDIVGRFHRAMELVYARQVELGNPNVRLHVVAHSEGTVVSFLGLLRAMSGHRVLPGDDTSAGARIDRAAGHPDWLKQVTGYMTIGSPIDKHLLLWPHLWTDLSPARANTLFLGRRIQWHNYYDYGDPVGFKLDTARFWLGPELENVTSFDFSEANDHGFARYPLPGKAHIDYWNDPGVFDHFVTNVVKPVASPLAPPRTKPAVAFASPLVPYLLSLAVLLTGTYLLYKQVGLFAHPDPEPLEAAEILRAVGIERTPGISGGDLFTAVCGVSGLVAGATLLARLPRLAAGLKWKIVALLGFLAGCALYVGLLGVDSRDEIGAPFRSLLESGEGPTVGVCGLALLVGLGGYLAVPLGRPERKNRWFWKGVRPLVVFGALAVLTVLSGRIFPEKFGDGGLTDDEIAFVRETSTPGLPADPEARLDLFARARLTRDELDQLFGKSDPSSPLNPDQSRRHLARLPPVIPLLDTQPALWPVALAAAAFVYLWWLATLVFDLGFIWHRYIRHATSNRRLRGWYTQKVRQTVPPFPTAGGST